MGMGLCTVLVFVLCACASDKTEAIPKEMVPASPAALSPSPMPTQAPQAQTDPDIARVKKKERVRYLLTNGVAVIYENRTLQTDYGQVSFSQPVLLGLRNKVVEKKLNQTILHSMHNEIKGSATRLKKNPGFVFANPVLNANNLLSLAVLTGGEGEPRSNGYLFRLTDGERLLLKDIFTEGTDYAGVLREHLLRRILYDNGEDAYLANRYIITLRFEQNFLLTQESLTLYFDQSKEGPVLSYGSGRVGISIPLEEIDDVVQVMDLYSGSERKNHEQQDLIERRNNLILRHFGRTYAVANAKVLVESWRLKFPPDVSFEAKVNDAIEQAEQEALQSGIFDPQKPSQGTDSTVGDIYLTPVFNHYGYLTFMRRGGAYDQGKPVGKDLLKLFSYNVITKIPADMEALLVAYLKDKPREQERFVATVNQELRNPGMQQSMLSYPEILTKGSIFFRKESSWVIAVVFPGDTFKTFSWQTEVQVPAHTVIHLTPEEFFGN